MKSIMYHYIRQKEKDLPFLKFLNIKNFKKQLDYFAKKNSFITKKEFKEAIINKKYLGKKVILTFDDGLIDHYNYVLPELKKRNLWGIFFIPSGQFKEKKLLHPHRVHFLLGKYGGEFMLKELKKILTNDMVLKENIEKFESKIYYDQNNDSFTETFKKKLNYLLDKNYRESVIQKLTELFLNEEEIFKRFYLTEEMIREMVNAGMSIGSHSVNHPILSELDDSKQEIEISDSSKFIDKFLNKNDLRIFCYPYGHKFTFNKTTQEILKTLNFDCAFSFNPQDILKEHLKYNIYDLNRYDCNFFPFGKSD